MERHIYNEVNGLHYTLGEDGMYYPNLVLKEQVGTYGKYGRMRKNYLQEHRKATFNHLLLSEKLHNELCRVDAEASEMVERLVRQMAEREGTDGALKMSDQMRWVGLMNNYKSCAEEIVLKDYIYV